MIPSATIAVSKPAGHLQVKKDRAGRAYWAFWRDAEGKHGRRLGPAHVKDSGRRTARGAVVWRAGDGSKPTPQHLTPKEAGAKLEEIVAGAPRSRPATQQGTLREACEGYAADRKRRNGLKPSTEMDYENLFGRLYRDFGADTPVADVVRRLREMNDRDESYIDTLKAQRIVAEAEGAGRGGRRSRGGPARAVALGGHTPGGGQDATQVPSDLRRRSRLRGAPRMG